MRTLTLAAGSILVTFALAQNAAAADCGDVDASGDIVTSDSLRVLRHAVQLEDAALSCPSCVDVPIPDTTSTTGDQCFEDEDCVENQPEEPICLSYKCVECFSPDHCAPGFDCVYYQCANRCGDFDANGAVAASDALMILQRAVGMPRPIACPRCDFAPPTTSTTQQVIEDECFEDEDCEGRGPGEEHCCVYECAECDKNEHCPPGFVCGGGCACVPL